MTQDEIFQAIKDERAAQDKKWGGADHDFMHYEQDWHRILRHQMAKAEFEGDDGVIGGECFEKRLVKIAAVAVAALEALS